MATGTQRAYVTLWNLGDRRNAWTGDAHDTVRALLFIKDGTRLFVGSRDGNFSVWDAARGEELLSLRASQAATWSLSTTADGACLASGHWNRSVVLWDVRPPALRSTPADVQTIDTLLDQLGSPARTAQRLAEMSDIDQQHRAALERILLHRTSTISIVAFQRLSECIKQNRSRAECVEMLREDPTLSSFERAVASNLAEMLVTDAPQTRQPESRP